jgi:hypothetical protein
VDAGEYQQTSNKFYRSLLIMAVHSPTEAAKLTQNDLQIGVTEAVITTDQSLQYADAFVTDRPVIDFNYEATLPAGGFIGHDDNVSDGAATFTNVTRSLRTLMTQVTVPLKVESLYSSFAQQSGVQIIKSAKGLGQTFSDNLVTGDNNAGSSNEIEGWATMMTGISATQSISANGLLSLEMVDQLLDEKLLLKTGKVAFVCNSKVKSKMNSLLRAAGGLTYETLAGTNLNVPSYRGVPILQNDYITGTSGNTGVLYAVNFDRENGVGLAFGRASAGPENMAGAGVFSVQRVGIHQSKNQVIYRVGCEVAQFLRSPKSLANIYNIPLG